MLIGRQNYSFAAARRAASRLALAAAIAGAALPASADAAVVTPVADSYVSASAPSTNYGKKTSLRTDASPVITSYIKFDVAGWTAGDRATLRVYANSGNRQGFQVRPVSDSSWSETGITSGNAPAYGAAIAASGAVQANTWYSIDVSSAVTGNGLVTLALSSASSTATSYSSREGTNPPELVVPAATPPSWFDVSRNGTTYLAQSPQGSSFNGTLKFVVESAVSDLKPAGGGTINFLAGDFDLGSSWWEFYDLRNITFQGQGIGVTTIRNSTGASTDTEPFDVSTAHGVVIRDLTVLAGGPFRSTSDAIDFDGGNDTLIERVRIGAARGRGIVFDGKDIVGGVARAAEGNVIRDCEITGVPGDGIELLAASRNRVEGCTIYDVGFHGIQMTKSSAIADQPNKSPNENVITGNFIDQSGEDGINLNSGNGNQILANTVTNSSDAVSSRDGIRVTSADGIMCDDNVVTGNTSSDNQSVHTQRYGLNIASANCHRTVVGSNVFSGNLVGPIKDLGTGTIYQ